jgi:hypothetical protein
VINFLKKIISAVFLVALFSGVFYFINRNPCDTPLRYTLGSFDAKFGLTQAAFLDAVAQAEAVWEKAINKDLFAYDAHEGLPVNLIYDSRQELINKNNALEAKIGQTSQSAEVIKQQFLSLKARFEKDKEEYMALVSEYEKAAKTERQKTLDAMYAALEQKRLEVNGLAAQINALIKKYNYLVTVENASVAEINKSADKEFEQGEYLSDADGERINIYEYESQMELVRVLAHELGHALGLDHNDNPASLMYYLNKSDSLKLSIDDIAALKTVCRIPNEQ